MGVDIAEHLAVILLGHEHRQGKRPHDALDGAFPDLFLLIAHLDEFACERQGAFLKPQLRAQQAADAQLRRVDVGAAVLEQPKLFLERAALVLDPRKLGAGLACPLEDLRGLLLQALLLILSPAAHLHERVGAVGHLRSQDLQQRGAAGAFFADILKPLVAAAQLRGYGLKALPAVFVYGLAQAVLTLAVFSDEPLCLGRAFFDLGERVLLLLKILLKELFFAPCKIALQALSER